MRCPMCDRPLAREVDFIARTTRWHCYPCRYWWTIEDLIADREWLQ